MFCIDSPLLLVKTQGTPFTPAASSSSRSKFQLSTTFVRLATVLYFVFFSGQILDRVSGLRSEIYGLASSSCKTSSNGRSSSQTTTNKIITTSTHDNRTRYRIPNPTKRCVATKSAIRSYNSPSTNNTRSNSLSNSNLCTSSQNLISAISKLFLPLRTTNNSRKYNKHNKFDQKFHRRQDSPICSRQNNILPPLSTPTT